MKPAPAGAWQRRLLFPAAAASVIVAAAWLLAPGLREVLRGALVAHADRRAADALYAGTSTMLAGWAHAISLVHGTAGRAAA